MRVAIVGLGYVGTVTGACLSELGHHVVGVDVNAEKVRQVNAGGSPITELGVNELIATNTARGRLSATEDVEAAVRAGEATIVCVGTPTGRNGDVHLDDVVKVVGQVGDALAGGEGWHLVVVTSTVPPGTVEDVLLPELEARSGRRRGHDLGIAFVPEFLREGTAVADFMNPTNTVIGAADDRSFETAALLLGAETEQLTRTRIAVAESVKFAANAWHALKVAFGNEMGRFCDAVGVDSQEVMRIFKQDTRLNISATYLTPGFAFGGSCLPKDVRTLTHRARRGGVDLPVVEAILPSNRAHLELALDKIQQHGGRTVALLGLAFKNGTDDLRESPALELAERLIGKGFTVRVHDEHVSLERLIGVNREYVLQRLPHIAELLREDVESAVEGADLVVVAQGNRAYAGVLEQLEPHQTVLDLTGVARPRHEEKQYAGLTW